MADSKVKMIKKGFVRYTKERFPEEAETILRRAEELFPVLYAKAPDIGGAENHMAYNLDLLILSASFYEASDRRIDGEAISEIAGEISRRYGFVRRLVDLNRPWQMKLFRSALYKRYTPWRVKINPRNTAEGVCFTLVGCPLADYARANGYEELLPHMCAADHLLAGLLHAKLIRTHTCATGSDSCDYWYVGDKSRTAKAYADVKMV